MVASTSFDRPGREKMPPADAGYERSTDMSCTDETGENQFRLALLDDTPDSDLARAARPKKHHSTPVGFPVGSDEPVAVILVDHQPVRRAGFRAVLQRFD